MGETPGITRRDFLIRLFGAGVVLLLDACGVDPSTNSGRTLTLESLPNSSGMNIDVSQATESLQMGQYTYSPDTHSTLHKLSDGQLRLITTSGTETIKLDGPSVNSLQNPQVIFGPTRNFSEDRGYHGYAGISSTIVHPETGEYVGFVHNEHWEHSQQHFPFTASISIVRSTDGISWQDMGEIINGTSGNPFPTRENNSARGAGQPCAHVIGKDVFCFYTNWDPDSGNPDSIHLAKAPVDNMFNRDAWTSHTDHGWLPISEGQSTAILLPNNNMVYTALPSVLENKQRDELLLLCEADDGWYVSRSTGVQKGILWTQPERFIRFPQKQSRRTDGNVWFSYASLINPKGEPNFSDSDTLQLLYSRGVWSREPHTPQLRTVKIKYT